MVRLFMVPWDAAGTRWGAAWARAPRITSTMRWEVSTLPPATAAGGRASTTVPGVVRTSTGRRQPALAGMSRPWAAARERSTYRAADRVMARTALTLPRTWGAEPVKSRTRLSPRFSRRRRMGMSRAPRPSSSRKSVKPQAPSGRSRKLARVRASAWSRSAAAWAAQASCPWPANSSSSRARPVRLAMNWAAKSPRRSSGVRTLARSRAMRSGSVLPSLTRRRGGMTRPSWWMEEDRGMDPGDMPPTSAWWARLATRKAGASAPGAKAGATRVMSGRWVPPRNGSFRATMSPGRRGPAARAACTDRGMEPRCTGMWAAWASMFPAASNTAQEKSRRSLILGEYPVRMSVDPISSAMEAKRCRNTSRRMGFTSAGLMAQAPG